MSKKPCFETAIQNTQTREDTFKMCHLWHRKHSKLLTTHLVTLQKIFQFNTARFLPFLNTWLVAMSALGWGPLCDYASWPDVIPILARSSQDFPSVHVLLSALFGKPVFYNYSSAEFHDKRLLTKCLEVCVWPGDCEISTWVNDWKFQPLDRQCLGRTSALSAGRIWWIHHQND